MADVAKQFHSTDEFVSFVSRLREPRTVKPPLREAAWRIWAIRIRLQLDHRARGLAVFILASDSKLRGCDLAGLHVRDVFQGSHVAPRAIVMQKKTQRPVQFEIT